MAFTLNLNPEPAARGPVHPKPTPWASSACVSELRTIGEEAEVRVWFSGFSQASSSIIPKP